MIFSGSKSLIVLIPALAGLSLFTSEPGSHIVRRLAADCIQNVYAGPQEVGTIPSVPLSTTENIPAYLALCQEWIRHDAYYLDSRYETYRIVEDQDVCMDWAAPHMALMDIYAGLIISAHVPRIKYRHNCDRTKTYSETKTGFDHTTIQQVLNTPGLRSNDSVLSVDKLKQQCRRCLLTYDPQLEVARVKAKGYHHPFAFPEDESRVRNWNAGDIPYVPYSYPGVAPFSTIIVAFRQRLYHSALEWRDVTDAPPYEEEKGVVYWIDPTTIGLKYEDALAEIQGSAIAEITTISILAGPLCATATLPTGENCFAYATGLKDYITEQRPALVGLGHKGEHGVTFKMITSTAAAFSRMILAQMLICPPRSPSCLFPSAAKRVSVNKALVLDDAAWMKSVDFMSIAGHHGTTTTKVLDASKIPVTYTEDPTHRKLWSTQQDQINALTDSEGFPQGSTRPPTPDDATIDAMTPVQILDDLAIALDRFEQNPNKYMNALEVIPSMKQIQQALADGVPLTTNQMTGYTWPDSGNGGTDYRHGELSTDADSTNTGSGASAQTWTDADVQRHASLLRMQRDWATAFYGHVQHNRAADDPSTVFEIECPTGAQPDGSTVNYFDGTAVTVNSEHIIIAEPSGLTIKDVNTGVVISTNFDDAPDGTVYRDGDGYKLKQPDTYNEGEATARRVVEVNVSDDDLHFKHQVQKVCKKYSGRLDTAVKAYEEKETAAAP